ncbi:MAG: SpoVR family protein [Solirubrobacterales bacterium]|nr:SpoVR family protein [Solirubrobacterales bacterium]
MSSYTISDLQAVDERCREIAIDELGFDLPEVIYHLVRPEEVYFAAANGLPARYSSARWGAQYDDAYGRYQRGRERVYELIFNTRPVHAYLMVGNSFVAQTLVVAHCLGHGYVFDNNAWLGAVDREIMSRVVSAAQRIGDYMGAHGRDRVEDFLDACHAIAVHQPQAQLIRKAPKSEPEHRERPYDVLFPDEVAASRERASAERSAMRRQFPREPEEHLLGFIERHARGLEDWQRDVISVVRSEQSYFLPQMRTKVLNEGAAVLTHQEICQRLFMPTDRYWEFEQLNAIVTQPHPGRVNPYNLGVNILREVMRIATDPDDEERERWSWAGNVDPLDQVRLILCNYDDEALLREFLTPKVCELARLYAFEHLEQDPRRIRISSREADAIRDVLILQHSTLGIPHVEIIDADYRGRGDLLLKHRHEGVGLDEEYARGTLTQVALLWGKPVTVKTIKARNPNEPVWFTGHPSGRSERHSSEPRE